MLLTASSRPIVILSFPARSNSWLSASTIKRACRPAGAAAGAATGAAAAAGAGVGATPAAGAGAPSRLTPQFEQKASPSGFTAPQDGHTCVPAGAAAGAA